MKKKNDFKLSCLSLLIVGMGMFMTACSGNDDVQEPVKPHEDVVLDADTLQVFEDFTVKFQLLNADNQPVTTFKEGENFTFVLSIINTGNDNKEIPLDDFLETDFFPIYTAGGKSLGKPYDMIIQYGIGIIRLAPNESFEISCRAFGKRDDDTDHGSIHPEIALIKVTERSPLAQGDYYTKFELKLNNAGGTIICKKEFKIE